MRCVRIPHTHRQFYYHGTTMENLPTIISSGLLPVRKGDRVRRSWPGCKAYQRRGLFLTSSEELAAGWAEYRAANLVHRTDDYIRAVVVRFESRRVEHVRADIRGEPGNWVTPDAVPARFLQIRKGAPHELGPWEPLLRYAEQP